MKKTLPGLFLSWFSSDLCCFYFLFAPPSFPCQVFVDFSPVPVPSTYSILTIDRPLFNNAVTRGKVNESHAFLSLCPLAGFGA